MTRIITPVFAGQTLRASAHRLGGARRLRRRGVPKKGVGLFQIKANRADSGDSRPTDQALRGLQM
jgi:acyl dehydratase